MSIQTRITTVTAPPISDLYNNSLESLSTNVTVTVNTNVAVNINVLYVLIRDLLIVFIAVQPIENMWPNVMAETSTP